MPIVQGSFKEVKVIQGEVEVSVKDCERVFMETQSAHSLVNHAYRQWLKELFPSMANRVEDIRFGGYNGDWRWEYVYDEHPHCGSELTKPMRKATATEWELYKLFNHSHTLITETTK